MKKLFILIAFLLAVIDTVWAVKENYTYTLKQLEPSPLYDKFFYPGAIYIYSVEAFEFRNNYHDFRIEVKLSNGKFENGKPYLNASYDSIRSVDGIKIKWDDVVSANDMAIAGKIYVSKVTLNSADTAKVTLRPQISQINAKIASLKGKVPVFSAGPNPPMGTNNEITATVAEDIYYPRDLP